MSHMTVAVLFGGQSSEHEVSRRSAYTILTNLPRDRYDAVMVGITKSGVWRLYTGDPAKIPDGSWESDPGCRPAFFSPSREFPGLLVLEDGRLREIPVDVVFPALHGKNGEDGAPQGLFQLSGVPCVGCSAAASVLCMDKAIANSLLETAGIPQAHYLWFFARNYKTGAAKIKVKVAARLGYPVFVKPANAGSSVGVSKVLREEDLDAAVEKAAHEDSKIVIEEAITGQEVECAVLGNAEPQASGAGEIGAAAEFYDYDDKYVNGEAQLYLPARIPDARLHGPCARGFLRAPERRRGAAQRAEHAAGLHGHQHVPQALGSRRPAAAGAHRPPDPPGAGGKGSGTWMTAPSAFSTPASAASPL